MLLNIRVDRGTVNIKVEAPFIDSLVALASEILDGPNLLNDNALDRLRIFVGQLKTGNAMVPKPIWNLPAVKVKATTGVSLELSFGQALLDRCEII